MSTIEKALDKLLQEGQIQNADANSASGGAGTVEPAIVKAAEQSAVTPATAQLSNERLMVDIDTNRLSKLNFVANAQERSQISEEYRVIKRKLINNAFGALSSTLNTSGDVLQNPSQRGWNL